MANSRISRFVSEVAPQQYISVTRQRKTKTLETITEDEKEASMNESGAMITSFKSSFSSASYHQTSRSESLFISKHSQRNVRCN
ncbi:hypothetical protein CTI12_AA087130 [Artemisia annua]|uniref:Uncharacterized protein n=1 Tax=Artemisia annua TaxID=35608 RepID=A0A2U1Q182_ARTAN|nr:hypothetical protein CTI12_AA087130 [Artemisia annua]